MSQFTVFSEDWFEMLEKTNNSHSDLNLSPTMRDVKLNVTLNKSNISEESLESVTKDDNSNVEKIDFKLIEGKIHAGHDVSAETTLELDFEVLLKLLKVQRMTEVMQTFINGDIKVMGNMSQLMTLQMANFSDEQVLLYNELLAKTKLS